MELPIVNMAGEKVGNIELPAGIFEAKINNGLMHQALVRQMANGRAGTHKAKGRAEIRRTGAKIYRQKGTGNARHGSKRAPIFVGGGVAHGPQVRDYSKRMPRKMRQAAIRSALSAKAAAGDIVIVEEVTMDAPKTKEMVSLMDRLIGTESALLLMADSDTNVAKSASNLPDVKAIRSSYLNIRDLLGYEKLVLPVSALDALTSQLGDEA